MKPSLISAKKVLDVYGSLLLDSFGVLVDFSGVLPHAQRFINDLNHRKKDYFLITNGASRTLERTSLDMKQLGLEIAPERIVNSGSLLKRIFSENDWQGARSVVIGTEMSKIMAKEAGADVVNLAADCCFDVLILSQQPAHNYLKTLEQLLSIVFKFLDQGKKISFVLTNPDFMYPLGDCVYSLTSGSVAMLLEEASKVRYGSKIINFLHLGKPEKFIFEEARRRAQTDHLVMIGDQLYTDIAGANNQGIDSVLLLTGLTHQKASMTDVMPKYLMKNLSLDGEI